MKIDKYLVNDKIVVLSNKYTPTPKALFQTLQTTKMNFEKL